MKVWCIPVSLPDPAKEKEQAQAALHFLSTMKGLQGFCPHESGNTLVVFGTIENARSAKWKLEEFCAVSLPIIEGTLSRDKKKLNCNKVVKGE